MTFRGQNKYVIADPYLRSAITYRHGEEPASLKRFGFPSVVQTKESWGYLFLLMLLRREFGIFRYPGYEDRHLADEKLARYCAPWFSTEATEELLEESGRALRALHEMTQQHYRAAGATRVSLRRGIVREQARQIAVLVDEAQRQGQASIFLNMDTLNHFSTEREAYCTDRDWVELHLDVPVSDILCCAAVTDEMESGEYLIINRSPTGTVEIPTARVRRGENMRPAEYRPLSIEVVRTPVMLRQPFSLPEWEAKPLTPPLVRLAWRLTNRLGHHRDRARWEWHEE